MQGRLNLDPQLWPKKGSKGTSAKLSSYPAHILIVHEVTVAMSGGVDSAVTAGRLAQNVS